MTTLQVARLILWITFASASLLAIGAPTASAHPTASAQEQEISETSLSPGLVDDLKATADSFGWTFEEALAQHNISEKTGWVQTQIYDNRPDQFIGGALSKEPGGVPKLYIKGVADEYIRNLVASAGTTITIVDEQPFSQAELSERSSAVMAKLSEMGFKEGGTYYELDGRGTIIADVSSEKGPKMSVSEIRERILAETGIETDVRLMEGSGFKATDGARAPAEPDVLLEEARTKEDSTGDPDQSPSFPWVWAIGVIVLLAAAGFLRRFRLTK